jgi:hypothetical protein
MCLPLGPADSRDVPILPACPARHPAEGKSTRVVAEALAGLQVKGGPVARMRVLYEVGGCVCAWFSGDAVAAGSRAAAAASAAPANGTSEIHPCRKSAAALTRCPPSSWRAPLPLCRC